MPHHIIHGGGGACPYAPQVRTSWQSNTLFAYFLNKIAAYDITLTI